MGDKRKTWETTKEPNVLRNTASGRFYSRYTIAGKSKWTALRTKKFSVAVLRNMEERRKHLALVEAQGNSVAGTATVGELIAIASRAIDDPDAELEPASKRRRHHALLFLQRSWPVLAKMDPRRIDADMVTAWRKRASTNGSGYKSAFGGPAKKGASASTVNKAVDALRRVLQIAVTNHQISTNPVPSTGVKVKDRPKKAKLPSKERLQAVLAEIERRGGTAGKYEAADFARFLMVTGARLREAGSVRWRDLDFEKGTVTLNGTKSAAATRTLPMFAETKVLLERIRGRRTAAAVDRKLDPSAKVLGVSAITVSLTNACKEVGVARLTHHDLRDVFATTCVECGVAIPTIAHWMGHKDGGALLLRVYNDQRPEQSKAEAAKVNFGGNHD